MKEKKPSAVKFPTLVLIGMIFTMIGCRNIFGSKEILHAYGIIEIAIALALLSVFLWKEMKKIFPADNALKKKKMQVAGSIAASLIVVPLAVILLPWQFYMLFEKHKAVPGSDKNERAYYVIAALIAVIGSASVTYIQATDPVTPMAKQEAPADASAPPVHTETHTDAPVPAPPVAQ
jgi:hypothetical protein